MPSRVNAPVSSEPYITMPLVEPVLPAMWNSNVKSCDPAGLNKAPSFTPAPLLRRDCDDGLSSESALEVGEASTQPATAWSVRLCQKPLVGRSEADVDKTEYPSIVAEKPDAFLMRACPVVGSTTSTSSFCASTPTSLRTNPSVFVST